MEIPHHTAQIRDVHVLRWIGGLALRTVHVEGVELPLAFLPQSIAEAVLGHHQLLRNLDTGGAVAVVACLTATWARPTGTTALFVPPSAGGLHGWGTASGNR